MTYDEYKKLQIGDVVRMNPSDEAWGDCIVSEIQRHGMSKDNASITLVRPYLRADQTEQSAIRTKATVYMALETFQILPIPNHLVGYKVVSHGHTMRPKGN